MTAERLHFREIPISQVANGAGKSPLEPVAGSERGGHEDAGGESGKAIVVLGPPGVGKGTQSALLSERLGFPHVSTGDMLRDRILIGDELGKAIAGRIDIGQFVPDEWIERLLEERVSLPDCRHGVIFDGYPRTLAQAKRFLERLPGAIGHPPKKVFVVRLHATPETLVARFSGRRQCSACGTLFHLRYQPSLAGDLCDRPHCSGTLEPRRDDRPEFVARRLADFEALTAPVTDFFQGRVGGVAWVDAGEGSPEAIQERVLEDFREFQRRDARAARSANGTRPGESVGGRADVKVMEQATLLDIPLEAAAGLVHEDRS
ncbi:MAG: nucleoside monophosphate kinase [Bryobacterales bacterium]|nr:nucleoside monophosphate kinase [Bryobacterales bacterium]